MLFISVPSTATVTDITSVPLGFARAEARKEHNEHAEEEQDHGGEGGPHADGVVGVEAGVGSVNVGFDWLVGVLVSGVRVRQGKYTAKMSRISKEKRK